LLKDIELLVSWFGVNHCRMDVLGRERLCHSEAMGHILHIISILVSPAFLLKAGGSRCYGIKGWYDHSSASLIRPSAAIAGLSSSSPHVPPRALPSRGCCQEEWQRLNVAEQMFSSTGGVSRFSWSPEHFPPTAMPR
jgi:hypothetical protein